MSTRVISGSLAILLGGLLFLAARELPRIADRYNRTEQTTYLTDGLHRGFPETYEVRADGELLTCQPAEVLPMAQRYFLF